MTPFARRVYRAILSIPLGEVRTYKWVARKAGKENAYRAVGTLLKNNPFPLIIPCHRVIKSNNILGRYRFGVKRKKAILDLERQIQKCLTNNE
ncbi:MAG: methylated-DNA--[protein]-cysteine S-methyltransferase [Candidatus Omnitrophota bacterium]